MSVPHLSLFGPPVLRTPAGYPLPFRTRKQLALLVYLALEGRQHPVPRERLVDLLWHDVAEERGRHSLSQALTAIRGHLGAAAVSRGPGGVQLVARLHTDLDLLRGEVEGGAIEVADPLRDLESVGGSAFSHWVDVARAHLVKHARKLLADALHEARARGDVRGVHERATQLYRVDPLSDLAVHALAEQALLERDAPGAVRLLRGHLDRTREALGCEPQPDVARLLRRIEGGAVRPPEPDPAIPERALRREIFVGRERELARLEALWAEARAGALRTALALGPSGIGKSALVRRFGTSVAARAGVVWEVACQEIGKNVPFAATAELIQRLLCDPAVAATDAQWLAEASRIVPAVRARYPGVSDPPEVPADSIRLRLAEAVLRMIEAAADGGPALVVVDDVQHMDPASRHVFNVLTRRLEGSPAFLLATIRTDDAGGTLTGLPRAVEGVQWSEQLELSPLERAHARELAAHLCEGDPGEHATVPDRIVGMAEGNAYLIEMLATDWRTNGTGSLVERGDEARRHDAPWQPPSTMRAAFARMYEGLSDGAQQLLRLLAVAGRSVDRDRLPVVLPLDRPVIERAVLELIDRGLVRLEAGAVGFKNEPHRAFVYYATSEEVRKYHHARLAEGYAASATDETFARTLEASHHFLKAGMLGQAIDLVSKGTEVALAQGAPREAERAIQAVLAQVSAEEHPVLQLRLAMALNAEGRYREALDALAKWRSDGATPEQHAAAALTRAESMHRARLGNDSAIADAAHGAVNAAREVGDEFRLLQALQLLAELAADIGNDAMVAELASEVSTVLRNTAPAARGLASLTRGYCDIFLGQLDRAIDHLNRAVDILERSAPHRELSRAVNGVAIAKFWTCRHKEALADLWRAHGIAKAVADDGALSVVCSNLGVTYSDLGEYDAAESVLNMALSLRATQEAPRRAAEALVNLAALKIATGEMDQAAEHIESCRRHAQAAQSPRLLRASLLLSADIALISGHPETAWQAVEETIQGAGPFAYRANYERLRLMYEWTTRGYRAFSNLRREMEVGAYPQLRRDELGTEAITEWIEAKEGKVRSAGRTSAFEELRNLGLHGILAYLARVGVVEPKGPLALGNRG